MAVKTGDIVRYSKRKRAIFLAIVEAGRPIALARVRKEPGYPLVEGKTIKEPDSTTITVEDHCQPHRERLESIFQRFDRKVV